MLHQRNNFWQSTGSTPRAWFKRVFKSRGCSFQLKPGTVSKMRPRLPKLANKNDILTFQFEVHRMIRFFSKISCLRKNQCCQDEAKVMPDTGNLKLVPVFYKLFFFQLEWELVMLSLVKILIKCVKQKKNSYR